MAHWCVALLPSILHLRLLTPCRQIGPGDVGVYLLSVETDVYPAHIRSSALL